MNNRDVFGRVITIFFTFFFMLIVRTTRCQHIEFGTGIGALGYIGDINRGVYPKNFSLGVDVLFRANHSNVVSTRYSLLVGGLQGSDDNFVDILGKKRGSSFKTSITEVSGVMEYYFLDYKNIHSPIRWSPYLFGGLSFFHIPREENNFLSNVRFGIPFGIGFKQLIGQKYAISIEGGLRKLFTDDIDGVSDGSVYIKNYQYGNPNDNDWYYFIGISFVYILYNTRCNYEYKPVHYRQ
ncbi:MAG: DUF6089 family protein [Chitinophagaceae bacterium]|nr:DUF6089 family protein [Chitinophagaceae bacterium]